ncbi:MAG: OsmC family protein [Chloroflexota bacterium]
MKNQTVTVTMSDGFYTTASSRTHTWHADMPGEDGGTDRAPTPEELVMGTLGSCMAQTAKLYADRKGWQIDRIEIKLNFERFRGADYQAYDGDAAFIHEIREHIVIEGPLEEDQKARVREIMGKCPIRRLIANPAFFVEADPEPEA